MTFIVNETSLKPYLTAFHLWQGFLMGILLIFYTWNSILIEEYVKNRQNEAQKYDYNSKRTS